MKKDRLVNEIPFVKRRFAVDTISTFLVSILTGLLNLCTGVLIARYLGPGGKGIITLCLLVLGQLGMILTFGVEIALVHYAGRKQWKLNELASAAMGLSLLLGVAGIVIGLLTFILVFQDVVNEVRLPLIFLMTSAIPMILNLSFLRSIVRVSGRIIEDALVGGLSALLNLIMISIALISNWGLDGVLVGAWFSFFFLNVLCIVFGVRWKIIDRRPIFSLAIWKYLVRYGVKSHVGSILQSLNYRFDIYLVGFFLGSASIGLYSVAVAMAEWLWLIPSALGTALMQRVATSSDEEANVMIGPLNRLTSGILLVGAFVWAFLGGLIIKLLYGEAFSPSYLPLLLLLPGIWAIGLWKNFINDLSVRGCPAIKSYTSGIAVLLTVILDIVLIPKWGIAGAAIASSIAYMSAFGGALFFYCPISHYNPKDLLMPQQKDVASLYEKLRDIIIRLRSNNVSAERLRFHGK